MKFKYSTLLIASICCVNGLIAQDEADLNFVRDWVAYRVVPEFAPNPNNIEVFNDYCIDFQVDPKAQGGECASTSPYGLEYNEFLEKLATAYTEGRGGVIDFETPIIGPIYQAPDRTDYRAFIDRFMLDNPLEVYDEIVREEFPELNDLDANLLAIQTQKESAYAAAEAELQAGEKVSVVARSDRRLDDTEDRALNERLLTSNIVGFYGPDADIPLIIRRGEKHYAESGGVGSQASANLPGSWDLDNFINAEFFTALGEATYDGGSDRPVSGIFTANAGMMDLRFDPRDNVKVVGFVILSFNNFQYWQGESGIPDNPNNIRVFVEFGDGTTEELAQTSRQSGGLWDVFFAVEAPEDSMITRIWLRIIGKNARTFISLDDLSFITEPAESFVATNTEFTGSEGAAFYEILQIGQNPESVIISNLPAGLSYDAEKGLISGTFDRAGDYTAMVQMTNSVGTSEQELIFSVGSSINSESTLKLDPINSVNVVLRRSLPEIPVTSNLDDSLPAGAINYFTLVEKLGEDGSRNLTSLDFLGLTLRDNSISGTPGAAQQIGTYEVTVFARTPTSADSTSFILTVLAPTVAPNFDSNGTTDFAVLSGGSFWAADNPSAPGEFGTMPLSTRVTGIPANASVFPCDLNGDNRTDLLVWDAGAGSVRQYLSGEGSMSESVLMEGIDSGSGEQIIDVADFDGDGTSDIFWRNDSRGRDSIWLMRNGRIAWAGPMDQAEGVNVPVMTGDFAGDGSLMHLFGMGSGVARYSLVQYETFTSLGEVQSSEVEFTMDFPIVPTLTADFTNDGRADILWQNNLTGEASVWAMQGTSTDTSYLSSNDDGSLSGLPGDPLLPIGFDWSPVTAVDLNNDQFADLVIRNRNTKALGVLFQRNGQSLGTILTIGGADHDLVAAGDYDGNTVNDLLVHNTATNALSILAIDSSGAIQSTPYGSNPPGAVWLGSLQIENTASAIDSPYSWLGDTTFLSTSWMYASDWGYLSPVAVDPATGAGWFYDMTIGYVWTSPQYFPAVFQGRNAFWLRYVVGSMEPRWFYNYIFGFYMTENEL